MDNENKIIELLEQRYESFLLNKKQLANIMSLSLSTIDSLLRDGSTQLPAHIKMGQGDKSAIRFTVTDVARFLGRDNSDKEV